MGIIDRMAKAYETVTASMKEDSVMTRCARLFYRNKKYAYFIEARRLDKDGYLVGEHKPSLQEDMTNKYLRKIYGGGK